MPRNSFLSDKNEAAANDPLAGLSAEAKARLLDMLLKEAPTGKEIDLSKPIVKPYNPRDPRNSFPRMMYNHKNGHTVTVANLKQQQIAEKKGYSVEPGEEWDYSRTPGGYAARKTVVDRIDEITAEDLEDLDDEEARQGA